MPTYIPKQIKPVRERVEAKLDREVILELEQYCQYLESDRDYVIAQALSRAFRKDKGFTDWKAAHPTVAPGRCEPETQVRSPK
jgi:hypothetical protein